MLIINRTSTIEPKSHIKFGPCQIATARGITWDNVVAVTPSKFTTKKRSCPSNTPFKIEDTVVRGTNIASQGRDASTSGLNSGGILKIYPNKK